jgi:hypothetical protein
MKIREGMTAKELFALMAPFRKVCTEHFQWPLWTDGHTDVAVTIWPDGGDPIVGWTGPWRVREKEIYPQGIRNRR